MKNFKTTILSILTILFFLIIQGYFIMYSVKVAKITEDSVVMSLFGQDFVYRYNNK